MNTGQWSEYGIETEEYSSYVEEEYADDGDLNQLQLFERNLEELRHAIDPLQDDAYRINTYLQVCLFVTEILY